MRLLSLAALLITTACAPAPHAAPTKVEGATIDRWDPAMDAIVPKDWKIEKLAEGFGWAEGPIWVKNGGYLLFTDVPGNKMWKWSEKGGLEKFLDPSGAAERRHEHLARSRRQRPRHPRREQHPAGRHRQPLHPEPGPHHEEEDAVAHRSSTARSSRARTTWCA